MARITGRVKHPAGGEDDRGVNESHKRAGTQVANKHSSYNVEGTPSIEPPYVQQATRVAA